MLQFFEPTQQLVAAFIIGSCTLFAAIVNAVAQLRVARDARRKSLPPPREAWRVRRWVVVGAGLALALGWSATTAQDHAQAADGSGGQATGLGVASLFGGHWADGSADHDALTVALLHLRQPLTAEAVVRLLQTYDLRAYAVDLRLADEPEAWLPVPAGLAPAVSMPRARLDAERRAWQEACAFESVLATAGAAHAAGEERDTLALRLVRARARDARSHAERLSQHDAVIHALRVLASGASASRVARDSAVARAEIARYDPGWPVRA
ncbi:MAG TPA: hypothetical protein VMN78_12785, partial [Longimicrobiales bacterium]|nr:hypothetical protein [Longimicrobiales bacterium]